MVVILSQLSLESMSTIETHPFQPFVPVNASVAIIGSFPGRDITQQKTTDDKWFYDTKRNQFWDIISSVYDKELKTVASKKQLFTEAGIAIADIILTAKRKIENNSDTNLEVITYNEKAIKKMLENTSFKSIFFTSKFVEKHFRNLFPGVKNGECLPSPSPRYARMSKKEKINYYKKKLPGLR